MRLFASRGQSFEGIEDVLARMVDHPIPTTAISYQDGPKS
jgi:hypothetical protein